MKASEIKEWYAVMFPEYPDIVTVKELQTMLEISRHLADEDISVKGFNIRTTKDMTAIFNITMEIRTKDQLERVNKRLKGIKGIIDIERVSG